ncbi:MAG: hypothetical protein ABFS56_22850 [Pseudomonadota bacterium]
MLVIAGWINLSFLNLLPLLAIMNSSPLVQYSTQVTDDLADVYYEHLYKEIEYWKPPEILDLLKRSLFKGNEQLIELAKEVLK